MTPLTREQVEEIVNTKFQLLYPHMKYDKTLIKEFLSLIDNDAALRQQLAEVTKERDALCITLEKRMRELQDSEQQLTYLQTVSTQQVEKIRQLEATGARVHEPP